MQLPPTRKMKWRVARIPDRVLAARLVREPRMSIAMSKDVGRRGAQQTESVMLRCLRTDSRCMARATDPQDTVDVCAARKHGGRAVHPMVRHHAMQRGRPPTVFCIHRSAERNELRRGVLRVSCQSCDVKRCRATVSRVVHLRWQRDRGESDIHTNRERDRDPRGRNSPGRRPGRVWRLLHDRPSTPRGASSLRRTPTRMGTTAAVECRPRGPPPQGPSTTTMRCAAAGWLVAGR